MKLKNEIPALLLTVFLFVFMLEKQVLAQSEHVSFQVFYNQLTPHGQWVDYPNYGYVWIPNVKSDFAPYASDGFWKLTNYGWTWISDYDWGWAPFHYGRWDYENRYGWFWVPGNEWGPAWVDWRQVDGYYGWRPKGPHNNMFLTYGNEYNSFNDHWIFVKNKDIVRFNINHYRIEKNYQDRIFRNSIPVIHRFTDKKRNATFYTGPSREDIQFSTGMKIKPVFIREIKNPGQNLRKDKLQIYRPQFRNTNEFQPKVIPDRISDIKEVKHPSERDAVIKTENSNSTVTKRRENQNTETTKSNNENRRKPVQNRNTNTNERNQTERRSNSTKSTDINSNRQQSDSKTEKTNRRNK